MTKRISHLLSTCVFLVLAIGLLIPGDYLSAAPLSGGQPIPPPPEGTRPPVFPFNRIHKEMPVKIESIEAQEQGGPDEYGYTFTAGTIQPGAWIDAANGGGTAITFSDSNDAVSEISIPFAFPFYENVYQSVFVSTNGVLSFGEGVLVAKSQTIPLDVFPNNLIAVCWDDLKAGNAHVYYKTGSDSQGSYFVIEWHRVSRITGTIPITFEAVLRPDGSILVQFYQVDDNFANTTIGIEDSRGINGLVYMSRPTSPVSPSAILFTRPSEKRRVQFLSKYAADFAINGQAQIPLQIHNNGDVGSDIFNLSIAVQKDIGSTAWQIGLYAADGLTPLTDTNGDGIPDTGQLPQGEIIDVVARLSAKGEYEVGDYTQAEIQAISINDAAVKTAIELQAAVPASFAQALVDSRMELGLGIDLVSTNHRAASSVDNWYSGSTFSMVRLASKNYFFIWEKNEVAIDEKTKTLKYAYTNLEFATLTTDGDPKRRRVKLTDHSEADLDGGTLRDTLPAIAPLPNGKIGVAWIRTLSPSSENNYNVYLLVTHPELDSNFPAQNITANPGFGVDGSLNVPIYTTPRIIVTANNHFLVAWVEEITRSGGEVSDVYYQLFDQDGVPIQASPHKLTNSIPDQLGYGDPVLVRLSGGQVLAGAFGYDTGRNAYSFNYWLIDDHGNIVPGSGHTISDVGGMTPIGIQLASGKILVGWTNIEDQNLSYLFIDGDTLAATPLSAIANPTNRPAHALSITQDAKGRVVLTWMDRHWYNNLYYALIGPDGKMITPPMIFYSGPANKTIIITNDTGQGSAPYDGNMKNIFLPAIAR